MLRPFWLTLFAIGAAWILLVAWQSGEPWTAAAFIAFFSSRVARSLIKRPLTPVDLSRDDADRRLRRFLAVTAAGWLASGSLAVIAALVGEGQEWLYVAPCFLAIGALQLYVLRKSEV